MDEAPVERKLLHELKKHKKSVLLLGPRQVGKSTLLLALKPDLVVNLAKEREYLEHSSDPGLIEQRIAASGARLVMIDEVQRIPEMLNTVQALIDERKIRFLLSGSSARKLKRGHANLLPGRVITYRMGGLSALELKDRFEAARGMTLGFLPEPYLLDDLEVAREILSSYSGTYLMEEVQAEMLVRNVQGFSRFLHRFAEVSGQTLDLSKVASKARVSRTGVSRFLEVLEETLLVHRCDPYWGAPNADLIRHPRYYFFDPGVLNGLLGGFELSRDRIGLLFEHAVAAQILNSAAAMRSTIELSYFRTRNGLEVDFMLKKDGQLWAIEAKSGRVTESDTRSLEAVRRYVPQLKRRFIVVPDAAPRRFANGIEVMGLARLIKEIFG